MSAETGGLPMQITALVTAYHPDERLVTVVRSALESCQWVIVIDNTPLGVPSASEAIDDPHVRVERSGLNQGLAMAFNTGLDELPDGTEAVLFLDQDSQLPPELVPGLARNLQQDPTIGAIGPAPYDAETGQGYDRFEGMHDVLADRFSLITSGMLVRRTCFDLVPHFRTDFFVDWVDNDFCLKLRRAGARVVLDRSSRLPHSIGDGRTYRFLFWKTRILHYAPWRRYWIARNGLILFRENVTTFPSWGLEYLLYMARTVVNMAIFGPDRLTHLRAFGLGLRHALSGKVASEYLPAGADYRAEGSD